MRKVWLTMIVKNEAHVIERCLKSALPYIHGYQIADTGSTDGTPDIIRRTLENLPGEVTHHPWVDFSHNRNIALELARGKSDYLLTLDADETMTKGPLPEEWHDGLILQTIDTTVANRYSRIRFFKNDGAFCYLGKVHEALIHLRPVQLAMAESPVIMSHYDSNRNVLGDKFHRDLKVLLMEPQTARNVFFLAQTYINLARYEEAIHAYQQRADMGGNEEEVYFSLLQIGRALINLKKNEEAMGYLFRAHCVVPQRYEALDLICQMLYAKKQYKLLAQMIPDTFQRYNGLLFTDDLAAFRIQEIKAHLLKDLGRGKEAAAVIREIINSRPWSQEQKAAYEDKIAKFEGQ